MRGIGRCFARLPVAAVVLAGAFAMARLAASGALAQTAPPLSLVSRDEVAVAQPRPALAPAVLPRLLPAAEARLLGRVFRLQAAGDMAGAARLAAGLADGSPLGLAMFGHVLADRYLNPATRPGAAALRDWLARWPDLPDAPAVYRLLLARLPDGEAPPPAIARPPDPLATADADDVDEQGPRRNPELDRDVQAVARARGADGVLHLLRRTAGLRADYAALLRGEAARVLFTLGRDEEALALGAGPPSGRAAVAGYAAGLAAWRQGRMATAEALFAAGWQAPVGTAEQRAACA